MSTSIIVQFPFQDYNMANEALKKFKAWEKRNCVGLKFIEIGRTMDDDGLCVGMMIDDINWEMIVQDLIGAGFGIPKCYNID